MTNKTREEMNKRLEQLETRAFYINMVDHWTREDRDMLAQVEKEIKEIKEMLK